ncbi:hypothetical protein [Novosphingobium sp. B 225]|uniref:hypothetical protein n=1 Tax=Novosphingobium sp. B 225 TaxID=1961849 RepID=UPI000B4B64A2|nr:hypothetical protein [Novosphingobium sp. B 225]
MATLAEGGARPRAEERFFFHLACAMAAVLVAGFSVQLAAGRSSFAVPLVYHLHGVVFFGWTALFLLQSWLVASGNRAQHRRLGWLAAIWVPVMVGLGMALTVASMRRSGGPFFFDANEFLIGNPTGLLAFAAMVALAVRMRRRNDWHRRLMICAMASITGPGFGRLLPMPLLIPWGWEISNTIGLGFVAAGMLRDRRHLGAVHPAWLVGSAVVIGWIALGQVLAYSDWGMELTRSVMAGHPGAVRPMEAYLP